MPSTPLSSLLRRCGSYIAAEMYYKKTIETRIERLGEEQDSLKVIDQMLLLTDVLIAQGKLKVCGGKT